jgi:hypothetical protein
LGMWTSWDYIVETYLWLTMWTRRDYVFSPPDITFLSVIPFVNFVERHPLIQTCKAIGR